jgi:hypothetical protein
MTGDLPAPAASRAETIQPLAIVRFEWEGDRITAVGGGAIEAPITWFVATVKEGAYIGYNLGIQAPVHMTLTARAGQDDVLHMGSGCSTCDARRLR